MLSQETITTLEQLIEYRDWKGLRQAFYELEPFDVAEVLEDRPAADRLLAFRILVREQAALVFEHLSLQKQTELVQSLADEQLVNVLNGMAPDDRTRLLEELPPEVTYRALTVLSPEELKVARQLLGYPEGSAGRFMTPKYITLRAKMTCAEALSHVRKNARDRETLSVMYVVGERKRLVQELKLETLVLADPNTLVADLIEQTPPISLPATVDREEVVAAFEKYDRVALPVTDTQGVLLGIITVDDVLDVAEEEATEDIQKLGGMQALESSYLSSTLLETLKKRVGWLAALFVGETFTASAMGHFESLIASSAVLSLFVPLIISSGGNSGSQAASLIIRSITLREVVPADAWKVFKRELISGIALGLILGLIGFFRVLLWHWAYVKLGKPMPYGPHYMMMAITIAISLVGVVLYGTLCGSMLPLLLRRLGLDPATASTPFVATLVDVSGVIIYFVVVKQLLKGLYF